LGSKFQRGEGQKGTVSKSLGKGIEREKDYTKGGKREILY